MDHTRDNPLKRFSAFWISIFMVALFGIAGLILRPLTQASQETAYMAKEQERLETRAEIDRVQQAALEAKNIDDKAVSSFAKTLNQAPTPGSMAVPPASK